MWKKIQLILYKPLIYDIQKVCKTGITTRVLPYYSYTIPYQL